MKSRLSFCCLGLLVAACTTGGPAASPPSPLMSFFVTSVNPGKGADLGGLAGADQHCQTLASRVGAGKRTWHAYLSAAAAGHAPAVDARDRIGAGPWYNFNGELIARNVEELHSGANHLNKETALTEMGAVVSGRGDPVNLHDILTGSSPEGRSVRGDKDITCGNWTRGSDEGTAIVGHHDRLGPSAEAWAISWNSSHPSQGCSLDALKKTGGGGLLYCFAVD